MDDVGTVLERARRRVRGVAAAVSTAVTSATTSAVTVSRRAAARAVAAVPVGTVLGRALSMVGVTDERASALLGRPCGCPARRRWLDQLTAAAARVIEGRPEAEAHLRDLVSRGPPPAVGVLSSPEKIAGDPP